MKLAVVGAGVAGLVAAYRLGQVGHVVDVYERWPGLGGQAATLDVGDGHRLERYYHHLFTSDRHIAALYDELGLPDELEWRESTTAFFAAGRQWAFTTPVDLLRFGPLAPWNRLRMGAAVVGLQRFGHDRAAYEDVTAREWILRRMGRQAWEQVWGPLLRGKFGARADDIAMVWLWSKFTLRRSIKGEEARRERLGYPRRSWEPLFEALVRQIEGRGGHVHIDRPAARIQSGPGGWLVHPGAPGSFRRGHDPSGYDRLEPERYDGVLSTVPNDVMLGLVDGLPAEYARRLEGIEYFTALCLLLEHDRPFTGFYWTNVADRDLPFVGLVEHTNFVEAERYGGRRFLYVANYLERGHPWLSLSMDELLDLYDPGLRQVNPAWSRTWIRSAWLFREPAAQPIVTVGYRDRIPPLRTGLRGLVLANTTQVYPEDRGTNYAVRLGEDAARVLLDELAH